MTKKAFSEAFHELLEPVLVGQGFRRVLPPDGWMAPTELFESHNRWFGASWDWRDRYLEVSLGRLFQYRDVLPRVIIQGPYSLNVDCGEQAVAECLARHLSQVAALLPMAVASFDAKLDESLRAARIPPTGSTTKARRIVAEHLAQLGNPLTITEWKGCRTI